MSGMAPEEANQYLRAHKADRASYIPSYAVEALETIAAMTTEADYRVVPHETVDGRYETRRYERHVTEWREVEP